MEVRDMLLCKEHVRTDMSITVDATLTSKGQVTIPKEIRDRLGLEAGQRVEFILEEGEGEEGSVTVRPKKSPMKRLADVKETIAARHGDIDVEAIRRDSKRAWSSVDTGDGE